MPRTGSVVLLSGGIDSAVCLAEADDRPIHTLHVDYGQQTAPLEASNARELAEHYDVAEHHTGSMASVVSEYAAGVADPNATFADQTTDDGRSSGYVPMRNLTLLSAAAGVADAYDLAWVVHGAQGGDAADYPDCRPAFMDAAQKAIAASLPDAQRVSLSTPLIHRTKAEVVSRAAEAGVPLELTYSCYRATDPDDPDPCGACPACTERQDAFASAGVEDPLVT